MDERLTPEVAQAKLAQLGGQRWVSMLTAGQLELEYYAPRGTDPQQPHTRDEMYFVLCGSGWFEKAGVRQRFGPGEVLFAAAGVPHRFADFSPDFATWAIFVGTPPA